MQAQVVEHPLRIDQADTEHKAIAGLSIDDISKAFNEAVKQDIAKKQEKGLPVARYDAEAGKAYLENPDGTREYV